MDYSHLDEAQTEQGLEFQLSLFALRSNPRDLDSSCLISICIVLIKYG